MEDRNVSVMLVLSGSKFGNTKMLNVSLGCHNESFDSVFKVGRRHGWAITPTHMTNEM
jgi:hypothetical protein